MCCFVTKNMWRRSLESTDRCCSCFDSFPCCHTQFSAIAVIWSEVAFCRAQTGLLLKLSILSLLLPWNRSCRKQVSGFDVVTTAQKCRWQQRVSLAYKKLVDGLPRGFWIACEMSRRTTRYIYIHIYPTLIICVSLFLELFVQGGFSSLCFGELTFKLE